MILQLKNLTFLDLEYQGIHSVPDGIARLKKLNSLLLHNNPMLQSLSSHVGLLPLRSDGKRFHYKTLKVGHVAYLFTQFRFSCARVAAGNFH